jgi:peptide/nickel transport system permease protein
MIRYLSKRALSSLIALFLFLTFMFFATEIMIPHDFTVQFSLSLNREQREELRHELGLDLPLWERYLHWLRRTLNGSLGTSLYGAPVVEVLKHMLPYTLLVFFSGTVIAFLFGQWLGKVVAWRGSGFLSSSATLSAIALYTSFPPWLAFLVTYFLAYQLEWFRWGYGDNPFGRNRQLWRESPWPAPTVMLYMVVTMIAVALILLAVNKLLERKLRRPLPGWPFDFAQDRLAWLELPMFIVGLVGSWFAFGFGPQALDVLKVAGLPLITYVLLSFGETMLIMRTSMTDTLKEIYVSTARAKGLPDNVVRDKHAARNALLPVLSRLVISLPYLLTGVVIIEQRFNWPGLSGMLFDSFIQQDMPLILGGLLVVGVLSAVARLVLDVLYAYLDPRVRHKVASSGRF